MVGELTFRKVKRELGLLLLLGQRSRLESVFDDLLELDGGLNGQKKGRARQLLFDATTRSKSP